MCPEIMACTAEEAAGCVVAMCWNWSPMSHLRLSPRRILQLLGVGVCCDDVVLFYCSPQTRLVAGWRVLKPAISALANKLNNKKDKKRRRKADHGRRAPKRS